MKRVRRILPTLFIIITLAAGTGVMAYPTVSDWWNAGRQSRAVAFYNDAVAALSEEDYTAYLEAAREYNEALRKAGSSAALANPDLIPGYYETLDVTGNGMMGTITIDKIGVDLPIYHGTDDMTLSRGAGHMKGSSLPIGGRG